MLQSLTIENVVVVDFAHIEFDKGFSVFTGETGAGKSILLDALSLVLGGRAQANLIRDGEERASVSAAFFPIPKEINALLGQQGFALEEGLIIRRTITRAGRNQVFINDLPVSLNLLNQIAPHLIDIHGQFDQLLLNSNHSAYLDQFSTINTQALEEKFSLWHRSKKELQEAQERESEKTERLILLDNYIAHLEKLNPQPNEEEALLEKKGVAKSAQKIIDLKQAIDSLSEEPANVHKKIRDIAHLSENLDLKEIQAIKASSAEISAHLMDLEAEATHLEALWAEEHDINKIEERIFALREAARQYHVETSSLAAQLETFRKEQKSLKNNHAKIEALENTCKKHRESFKKEAQSVHQKRCAAAKSLSTQIKTQLKELKLPHVVFDTQFTLLEEKAWSKNGIYDATFLVSTNPGIAPGPLFKVASGGEQSRIILALKTLVNIDKPTLVFDEIDTGLGGEVSAAMGTMLKKLSQTMQILSITHSPQLSAFSDHHFFVEKLVEKDATKTQVSLLTEEQRVRELSRMLAGKTITEASTEAARALLKDRAIV